LSGLDNEAVGSIEAIHVLDKNQLLLGSATGLHQVRIVEADSHGLARRVIIDQTRFADTSVLDIEEARDGSLWIATETEGAYLIHGNDTIQYGENEGLPTVAINDIYLNADHNVYCATDNGVYLLEEGRFVTLKGESELLQTPCLSLIQTSDGKLRIATESAGVCVFDGEVWTALDTRDGIAGNQVFEIYPHQDGSLWFGTSGGITRYVPNLTAPKVSIQNVQFEKPIQVEPSVYGATEGSRVTFEFGSIDFKTSAEKRKYQTRIVPRENSSSPSIHSIPFQIAKGQSTLDWQASLPGSYRFEVRAIDRDLNYSSIAQIDFEVVRPWFRRASVIVPTAGLGVLAFFAAFFFGWRSYTARRETRALSAKLLAQEREKNTALSEANERIESQKEELRDANQAKSAFLANMSHEIRTPLHTVLGYSKLLQKDPAIPLHQKGSASIIERSGHHLLTLINEVLDLSKIEAGRSEYLEQDFNLWDTINALDAMFSLMCDQRGLKWIVAWEWQDKDESPSNFWIRGDEQKLRQILINLLNNSIKFTETGEIRLTVQVLVQATDKSRQIVFEVADTGGGISVEDQKRVMEPFRQGSTGSSVGGTGLGLSIAKRLVELLSGELSMESKLGTGTTFSFMLSVRPSKSSLPESDASLEQAEQHLRQVKNVKALIAEDSLVNRQLLESFLTALSIEVTSVSNGFEAIEAFSKTLPDIVLMDIHMPECDGIEASVAIRAFIQSQAHPVDTRLVAVSASAFQHNRKECIEAGFDEFLAKPFGPEQLHELLARLLPHQCFFEDKTSDLSAKSPLLLPESLLRELKNAAELGSVADIERLISDAESFGNQELPFAAEMKESCRRFDFAGIRKIINQIGVLEP
jgi:signal transduction histidine kinase/DNA-binding NarL/FixJ family response regulator